MDAHRMAIRPHPVELLVAGVVIVAAPIYAGAALLQSTGLAGSALNLACLAWGLAWFLWLRRLDRLP